MSEGRTPSVSRYRELADLINTAMAGVPAGWQGLEPAARAAHAERVAGFNALMSELYDPLFAAREAVIGGDTPAREALIRFLEADIYCDRSGYFKTDAISALTRRPLTEDERVRLSEVVLAAVAGPDRREFRAYVRLARGVDGPTLRSRLETLSLAAEARTARHARWVLEGLGARATRSDKMRDDILPGLLRLLRMAESSPVPVGDLSSIVAMAAPDLDEPYRTALRSLAVDLRSSTVTTAREHFEEALRSTSPRDTR